MERVHPTTHDQGYRVRRCEMLRPRPRSVYVQFETDAVRGDGRIQNGQRVERPKLTEEMPRVFEREGMATARIGSLDSRPNGL